MNKRGQMMMMMVFGVEVEPIVAVGATSPSLRTVLDASDARGPHGSDDNEREDRNSPDRSVGATVAVPLVLTQPVRALFRASHNLKTRKTKAGR